MRKTDGYAGIGHIYYFHFISVVKQPHILLLWLLLVILANQKTSNLQVRTNPERPAVEYFLSSADSSFDSNKCLELLWGQNQPFLANGIMTEVDSETFLLCSAVSRLKLSSLNMQFLVRRGAYKLYAY